MRASRTAAERKVVAALRQFIEVDNRQALVSVMLLDEHRVVRELVGPKFNLVDFQDAEVNEAPELLALRKREGLWTDRNQWAWALFWSIQTGALFARRCMMEWSTRIGSPCTTPCGIPCMVEKLVILDLWR